MPSSKVFHNAKWIIICKVIQSLIQLIIGMLSARYLGPSNYGLISYAASIVAFAVPIMQLGLSNTLVQEYVTNPAREGEILGTGMVLNAVSALACIVGVCSFAAVTNPGDRVAVMVSALYSVSLLFQSVEMIRFWFQAKLLSKYSSISALAAYVIVSLYKVYLLVTAKNVYWFSLSHAIEYAVTGAFLLVAYRYVGGKRIRFSVKLAKAMFIKSRYYILANMMVTVFQNTDHVMLKMMVGNAENGFYTTAVTCSGVASFVYTAILDSARPVVLESKEQSKERFERNVARLYAAMIYIPIAQSLIFTILARPIVLILYGSAYENAIPVLRVVTWMQAFSCMGAARNVWILCEKRYSVLWKINLSGALTNVALNALLIPLWGACGAALASVLTQIFTNFIMGFILKPIRENNRLLLKGLDPRLLLEMAHMLKSKR